jgi:hypothetical protein
MGKLENFFVKIQGKNAFGDLCLDWKTLLKGILDN